MQRGAGLSRSGTYSSPPKMVIRSNPCPFSFPVKYKTRRPRGVGVEPGVSMVAAASRAAEVSPHTVRVRLCAHVPALVGQRGISLASVRLVTKFATI